MRMAFDINVTMKFIGHQFRNNQTVQCGHTHKNQQITSLPRRSVGWEFLTYNTPKQMSRRTLTGIDRQMCLIFKPKRPRTGRQGCTLNQITRVQRPETARKQCSAGNARGQCMRAHQAGQGWTLNEITRVQRNEPHQHARIRPDKTGR